MAQFRPAFKPLSAAILLASLTQQASISAQELVLEEIIVTSQIRAESLQDVSVSVSALGGDKLIEAGIDKIEDLQAYVPNLTMSETGIGTNIYIRGIGSGINQGFEQSTGMYIDGVSYGRAQLSRAPFLDLERVEVLRGPQNILFGKNSIAGALNIVTNKPTDEFEGSVSAVYEPDHGEEVFDLILSGPIAGNVAGRLAYRNRTMDGYIDNLTTGTDDPGRDEETIRLTLASDVNDELSLTFKYESGDFDVTGRQIEIVDEEPSAATGLTYGQILFAGAGGLFAGQGPTVLNTTQDFQRSSNGDFSNNSTENITLTADYALGDGVVTVILGSNSYDYTELCDCDFTGGNVFTLLSEEDYEQVSFEARYTSPVGETFEYITGFYYQDSELEFTDFFAIPADSILVGALNGVAAPGTGTLLADTATARAFEQDAELLSAFAQVTWNVSDDLRLTFGGRFSQDDKSASRDLAFTGIDGSALLSPAATAAVYANVFLVDPHSERGDRKEDNFSPLLLAELDINDDMMVYGSASQGFKSGGYDVRSNTGVDSAVVAGTFEFEEEEAISLELGTKMTLLDGAAELNIAVFFTQYDDLQISIFDGVVGFNVGNVAEAETKGIEIDGRWRVTESISMTGALAFLDFEFKDFTNGQCTQGVAPDFPDGTCDYTGETNQYVADWSGNVGLEHLTQIGNGLELRSNLDFIFTDDYNPSQTLDPVSEQDGYTKINARIALSDLDGVWEVALVGKNLTDEEISTYSNATPLAFSTFGAKSRYTFWERDRSIALQGVYRF